ncbi:MAG: hypothetical protein NTZ97_02805 [Candidatus Moranbacteria bacterium]|nr:hypothetical protein [Candidatus Moranbacteria bacterium]
MATFSEKLNKLPLEIFNLAISDTPMIEIKKSLIYFNINPKLSVNITGSVGLAFVGDFALENLPAAIQNNVRVNSYTAFGIAKEIVKRIFARFPEQFPNAQPILEKWKGINPPPPPISEEELYQKVLITEPWIADLMREKEELTKEEAGETKEVLEKKVYIPKLVNLPIVEALKKYPQLGEQLITNDKITLKSFPDPVRPSVKNWIADYTFNLGYEYHDQLTRSHYLFQEKNTIKLSEDERRKLAMVLKALDEKSPISVDENRKEIFFMEHGTHNMEHGTSNTEHVTHSIEPRKEATPPRGAAPSSRMGQTYNAEYGAFDREPRKSRQGGTRGETIGTETFKAPEKEEKEEDEIDSLGTLSFSSPQKMPFEKNRLKTTGETGLGSEIEEKLAAIQSPSSRTGFATGQAQKPPVSIPTPPPDIPEPRKEATPPRGEPISRGKRIVDLKSMQKTPSRIEPVFGASQNSYPPVQLPTKPERQMGRNVVNLKS